MPYQCPEKYITWEPPDIEDEICDEILSLLELRFDCEKVEKMSWVSDILRVSKLVSESPRKYWYWAGLSAISAVVNNKVYLDKFLYKLYPNIYVLLIGKSGIRKGPPVVFAKDVVDLVDNTRVFTGRVSIQAVLGNLQSAVTKQNGKAPIVDAIGMLASTEFASFLVQDPSALTILTDLYDGHSNPKWSYETVGQGKKTLKNPCVTFIGAANETHFRDMVPENALGGGFIARTCLIYADKKEGSNPLTEKPEYVLNPNEFVPYLQKLANLRGQFIWSRKGKERYDAWYEEMDKTEKDDSTGTLERIHDHVLKAAMLISLSRATDLQLQDSDIKEAIMACQDFVPGMKKLTMTSGGKSESAPGTGVLIRELLKQAENGYGMSRKELGIKHWQHFNMFELDKIVESLKMVNAVREEFVYYNDGTKELWYFLQPIVIDRFEKRIKNREDETA